jgi:hypothetical protein
MKEEARQTAALEADLPTICPQNLTGTKKSRLSALPHQTDVCLSL